MKAILDRDGITVGWQDSADLLDLDGTYLGFIEFDGFYDAAGDLLGHYMRGLFVDRKGYAVAFTPEATLGPRKPRPQLPPPIPIRHERHPHARVPLTPRTPMISSAWSAQTWQALLKPAPVERFAA